MVIRKNKLAMTDLALYGLLLAILIGLTSYFVPLTNSLNTRLTNAETKIGILNGTLTEQGNLIENLNSVIDAQNRTIGDQDSKIAQINKTVAAQSNLIASLNSTVEAQNETIRNQTIEITQLGETLNQQNRTISTLEDTVEEQDLTISGLKSQISNLTSNVTSLTSTVNQLVQIVQNQSDEIKDLQDRLAILENKTYPLTNDICFCFHVQNFDNQTIPLMQELNVKWIRSDWLPDYNMPAIFSQFAANNINILCIIDYNSIGSYNPSTWSQKVSDIVRSPEASYVSAWEIWNEPNSQVYQAAYINATSYYQALKTAYTIIKNQNYSQRVVAAGLAPIDTAGAPDIPYYQALYANSDIASYVDVQGVHLYSDAQTNLNDLNTVQNITSNKTIWVTEIGVPSNPPPYNDTAQASFIASNWNLLKYKAYEVFWYEFNDEPGRQPEKESYFGVITADDGRKPSFDAIIRISG